MEAEYLLQCSQEPATWTSPPATPSQHMLFKLISLLSTHVLQKPR